MTDTKQVIEQHIGAFNARNEDQYPWTEDFAFVVPGATLRGREEALGFIRGFWEAFPDARIEVLRVVSEGSASAGEGKFSGTHTGTMRTPTGEVAPTNRRVEFGWMAMYELAGDALAAEHLYFDQAELLGQLGLMPSG
jgi:predicted ester cyclase